MLKNKKGITLVALVVTIIILLILAGVAIAQLTENGLFEKAKKAGKESENAQIKEKGILADYESKIDEYVNGTRDELIVDKADYEKLINRVSSLEKKLEESTQQIVNLQNKNQSLEDNVNNIITGMDVSTKTTLFEGSAGTQGTTYTISDISQYKYLIVYADILSNSYRSGRISTIINVDDINYNDSTTVIDDCHYMITAQTVDSSQCYYISFWFKNPRSLYIAGAYFKNGWTSPRIYKIDGIK